MRCALLPFALLSSTAIACGGNAQLVVVVDTDLRVPSELAMIRAVISDGAGEPRSINDFALEGDDAPDLPFSFGVVPIDEDASRTISIDLTAYDPTHAPMFTTRARTGFAANRTLKLPMFLAGLCRTTSCSPDQTCTEIGCTSPDRPPSDLAEVEPGSEI